MSQSYVSQLDMMRKRSLAEGFDLLLFWNIWFATIELTIQDNKDADADKLQYMAEKHIWDDLCEYTRTSLI